MSKILPCPFCGGKAQINGSNEEKVFWLSCRTCLASAGENHKTIGEAIKNWNTRSDKPEQTYTVEIVCKECKKRGTMNVGEEKKENKGGPL